MTATDCPFCSPAIDIREEPIYFETERWRVTDNKAPYDNAKTNLLLLPKDHITKFRWSQKTLGLWSEFYTGVMPFVQKNWPQGTLLMRLGGFETTGRSIEHLHLHWIVPKPGQTVYAHMGPRKWKSEEWQDLKKT
ncbi:MAG: hypothetical protein AAB534_00085 [Patescibacteria group bacterium]